MLFGVKANVGSNPTVTANENPRETGGFLHSRAFVKLSGRHNNAAAAGKILWDPDLDAYLIRESDSVTPEDF